MGPLSDKLGRKNGTVIFGALSGLSFTVFALGTPYITNGVAGSVAAGLLFGTSISSYSNMLSLTTLMMTESTPASMRSSVIGCCAFFRVSAVLAIVATGMLFKVMPTAVACVVLAVPFLALGCLAVAFKTKETAGKSFEDIERDFVA
jgi:MFS family permease